MRFNSLIISILIGIIFIFFASCSKGNSLSKKLDELEGIIVKYEPKFSSIEYGSKDYSNMIIEYNKEIFAWAEIFEKDRYKKNDKGKFIVDDKNSPVSTDEFKEVEKRFYELNNRMTKMVLATIPKAENPRE